MLKHYRKKRDFSKTSEPEPKMQKIKKKKRKIFVIQEHHARSLHWDFRLEHDGVLLSWAVPKGVPLKKGEKRLAVQTEDHPLEYASFAGTIPEGEYGAGEVKIWDKGSFELLNMEPDLIDIVLDGKKVKGNYILIKPQKFETGSWLIFKK
ncbi:DNA polymerase ligase N-terminal domain-containing protein [Patescibacteria group bacterium]